MRFEVLAVAVLALSVGGCSFIAVRPAEHVPIRREGPDCSSYAAPIADTVLGTAYAALAVGAIAAAVEDSNDSCEDDGSAMDEWCLDLDFTGFLVGTAVVTGLAAGVHGGSAVYGYSEVSQCRSAL